MALFASFTGLPCRECGQPVMTSGIYYDQNEPVMGVTTCEYCKPGFFVIPVRIFGPCAGRAIVSSATITSKNRTEVFVQPTTEHASREYSSSSSGRNSDIFRPPSVSSTILMTEDTWLYRSPRAGFRSSARWTPPVASNSTGPSIMSSPDWNDSMSWRRSRRTIDGSSSSLRERLSRRFHFRSSERPLIRLLDPSSVHDVITAAS